VMAWSVRVQRDSIELCTELPIDLT